MQRYLVLFVLSILHCPLVNATRVTGTVRDQNGNALAYSSILIKGTTRGVTAGSDGRYSFDLPPGEYTLVCQYVGYGRQEKKVTVGGSALVVDFRLSPQQLSMAAVVVRPGGEDPAYAIIRHAIRQRKQYDTPPDSFTCDVYIKTLIRTRSLPGRILGQKIDQGDKQEMGVDSAGKGIIFLSESLTKVSFRRPNKLKLEVLSGRQSGSNGYGFTIPTFINFYDNNVAVFGGRLNPRGFVSPIAEGALGFYKYKFLGSYFEDGREINEIRVIPRRKYEPLFSGKIDIVEGDWRIYSLDLLLLKESQLQLLDTLEIKQLHAPVPGSRGVSDGDLWQVKNQVVSFTFNILGIDAVGNFLNVYNNYDVQPKFRRKFFNNVLVRYDTAGNKKTRAYWDSIRPLPLEPDEQANYTIRDSLYQDRLDSAGRRRDRDSLLRKQGPFKVRDVVLGFDRSDFRPLPLHYSLDPLVSGLHYNTVEGLNWQVHGAVRKALGDGNGELSFEPHIRYGFHDTRLNPWAELAWRRRSFVREGEDVTAGRQTWSLAGGKRIEQFDPSPPISEPLNDVYTLLSGRNYMKIYEKYFMQLASATRWDNGLRMNVRAVWEDRMPVVNTTYYTWASSRNEDLTPNYPEAQSGVPFPRHQALLTSIDLEYQPGQRFIEFPDRKVSIGSNYPILDLSYTKGWNGILGSDVNYDKWEFSVRDNVNLKLLGQFRYRLTAGGFLNARSVYLMDYQHFNGNQTTFASPYGTSLQMAPYYAYSTTAAFYWAGYTEHHFNGLLTNKIPLFRRLNWNLVGGCNAVYISGSDNYEEMFWGLENIFRIFRVDWVTAWREGNYFQTGFRIGVGGLLGGGMLNGRSSRVP